MYVYEKILTILGLYMAVLVSQGERNQLLAQTVHAVQTVDIQIHYNLYCSNLQKQY